MSFSRRHLRLSWAGGRSSSSVIMFHSLRFIKSTEWDQVVFFVLLYSPVHKPHTLILPLLRNTPHTHTPCSVLCELPSCLRLGEAECWAQQDQAGWSVEAAAQILFSLWFGWGVALDWLLIRSLHRCRNQLRLFFKRRRTNWRTDAS